MRPIRIAHRIDNTTINPIHNPLCDDVLCSVGAWHVFVSLFRTNPFWQVWHIPADEQFVHPTVELVYPHGKHCPVDSKV